MAPVTIGLVASVGGLAAVRTVLQTLPGDLTATVLVLIHQEPDRVSRLPQLLATHCALPVRHGEEGDVLRAGQVYVAPPGSHLLVTPAGALALVHSGAYPPSRPSADLLLTSMALALGDRAVAVVLSGGGTDGATGATAVHHFGGHVLTADEASSKDYSMPAATIARGDAVDETLPVGRIGARLAELAGQH